MCPDMGGMSGPRSSRADGIQSFRTDALPGDPPAPLAKGIAMTKKNVCFRLDEADIDILDAACGDLSKTRTEYFRYLLRIPLAAKGVTPPCKCIVLDTSTFEAIRKELVRWGYHYNQAVRSLNAIALYIRKGTLDDEWFKSTLDNVLETLTEVDNGRYVLERQIDDLQGSVAIRGD